MKLPQILLSFYFLFAPCLSQGLTKTCKKDSDCGAFKRCKNEVCCNTPGMQVDPNYPCCSGCSTTYGDKIFCGDSVGGTCNSNEDNICCTGKCDLEKSSCSCSPKGGKCGSDIDCCNGTCTNGKCGCAPLGGGCSGNDSCCSKACLGKTCCAEASEGCTKDSDCCTGKCINFQCDCSHAGGSAVSLDDCCLGEDLYYNGQTQTCEKQDPLPNPKTQENPKPPQESLNP